MSVRELRTLCVDEAGILLDIILEESSNEFDRLHKLLKSPKGRGVQLSVDMSTVGRPW